MTEIVIFSVLQCNHKSNRRTAMNTSVYTEYDIYEIEKKLTRTNVKASEFFATNDLLLQSFEEALAQILTPISA